MGKLNDGDSLFNRMRRFAESKKTKFKLQVSPNAKTFYRSYIANDLILPLNERLIQDVLSYNPKSVLEFGCGVGKNLALIKDKVPNSLGIDISAEAVELATKKGLNVICGDENILKTIENYDVVFTCSVLDHMEYIDEIVSDLKRIANTAIVIAETNTRVGKFYYPHDYDSLGFVKTDYQYNSTQAKKEAIYYIWHYTV
ncbi:MAG TPA: class I SAM-dependent methyltransferase [Nitrososphaera sp.]|jgi:2-polyprenyl-3-methyl-5-hydroxy-6-metoxy-1,4-benzoquinol methylase